MWQGFMEGGVRSGERAVCQVLGLTYVEPKTSSPNYLLWGVLLVCLLFLLFRFVF